MPAGEKNFMILVPECDGWNGIIEDCYGSKAHKVVRYAIKKERDIFVCAAKLILECLDRDWLPSWDAQNLMSVGLAKKLGYHFDREYTAYEVRDYQFVRMTSEA